MAESISEVKREIRYAVHLPANSYREDTHYVKEHITYSDGSSSPSTRLIDNYERFIAVTKQSHRNHKEKKEFEFKDNLHILKTTQSNINKTVANALEAPYLANDGTALRNSPYVYGYDITSTSLLKLSSLKRNNFIQSSYTVAAFDIETDIDTKEITIATIVFKDMIHTCITSKYINGISKVEEKVKESIGKYLPKYTNSKLTLQICRTEVDLIRDIFKVANNWAPDFLAIWNMNYDIPFILNRLKVYNVNPEDVICDQSVPRKLRVCRYKEGISKKVTSSGVVKPINPSLRWHSLISTTSFYVIDSMCVYRQLRMQEQECPSYSLDSILKRELNTQKLKFTEADEYHGEKWHIFMSENYKIEYIVYNIYDCLSMLELDLKLKDLSNSLPDFAGMTDFGKFNSNPKKIVDAMFLYGLELNRIVGTASVVEDKNLEELETDILEEMEDEEDEDDVSKHKTLGLRGWIQLLPQNLLLHDGLKCIEDYPNLVTNIRGMVFDLDASSAYPSCIRVANVSKETCINEVISIDKVPEHTFKMQNLSICLGEVNLLEYFNVMFDMPNLLDIDKEIDLYKIL